MYVHIEYAHTSTAMKHSGLAPHGSTRNTIATAGVLGGVTGLLLGGFWIGAAGFVASSYLAKKERSLWMSLLEIHRKTIGKCCR